MDEKLRKLVKSRDFWLIVIILVFVFYAGFFNNLLKSPIFTPLNTARLEIDYGERRRAFEGEIMSKMSVLDALLAASRGGDFEVRYAVLRNNTDIMQINGLTEDGLNGKSWSFYLNGQKVETGQIHKTQVKAGDKISVKFE